jgi:hypothetical protein
MLVITPSSKLHEKTLRERVWVKGNEGKVIPVTGREGPLDCKTSRFPHFLQTIGSQMAVRLSALRAGRPLPPRKIPGTH